MWNVNNNGAANGKGGNGGERSRQHGGPIAVGVSGVSGDKASQGALKWAIDRLVSAPRVDHVVVKLIHVAQRLPSPDSSPRNTALINEGEASDPIDEILLPFRCYCTRKGVSSEVVVLEDHDVAKALIEYISRHGIENFVLGSSSKLNGFSKRLFKTSDIPSSVQKWAPDFCNVYTVCKGKIYAVRAACRRVPSLPAESNYMGRAASSKSYDEVSVHEADMDIDLSFASSGRPSTDSMLYSFYENFGPAGMTQISSATSNMDITGSASELYFGNFDGLNTLHETPQSMSQHSASGNPFLSQTVLEEMEDEMKRLRMELKQTIVMYHAACKEAVTEKQKATELQEWKMKEEQRLEEALLTLEATAAALENEKAKSKAAILAAEAAPRLVEEELQKRLNADKMEENKVLESQRIQYLTRSQLDDIEIKSPFTRGKASMNKSYEISPETDISFVSSGRPSTDCMFPAFSESLESGPRLSISSDVDYRRSSYSGNKFIDMSSSQCEVSSSSIESGNSWSSQYMDEMEAEMRRLRLELKQTIDMYSMACKEALTEKHKAIQLHRLKLEEEQRLEEAREAEEAALKLAEKETAKCQVAMDAAEAAKRIAEAEAQKRRNAEMKSLKEAEQRKKVVETTTYDPRYRKYTIKEIEVGPDNFSQALDVGEGGYGPVYKGELDHTPVAIKVLRSDAAQGWSQFQQEVHLLSCIRHPNIILLLGACPENGCLVYEYMDNGSLEDRLFQRGNTPVIPWQLRFQIAAEIGTGLLFLHQTKPEPLVHRDLKPGNILLDYNYVSKKNYVGLARLVPPSVADSVTQYHMTSAAGTFCYMTYIDPEYQQTGMLGIKSDIYSLGVMFLQLLTARRPMGLTHHIERAIENRTFSGILDPAVPDWPVEEALCFAKLPLQCAEMRRKDRPDLGKVVLPELNRLRKVAQDSMNGLTIGRGEVFSPRQGQMSTRIEYHSIDLTLHLK